MLTVIIYYQILNRLQLKPLPQCPHNSGLPVDHHRVSSAIVERSNFCMRFVKNVYRSTMGEERLNALPLLFIHKDIPLNYNSVVDEYAKRYQRRMTFINPLHQ